jgi:hypothetical protein
MVKALTNAPNAKGVAVLLNFSEDLINVIIAVDPAR